MKALLILKAIDEGAPAQFQLLPYGRIEIEGEEDAFVDDESMGAVIAEFDRRGNDMVIDYEHQTLKGVQAPAAGWIKKLVNKGKEGLWVVVEWTEQAKEYLTKKEYRYFSPVFWVAKATRQVVKIENVALTNFPRVNNLQPIIAKMGEEYVAPNKQTKKEVTGMITKLRKLFGLADDAGEDKVVASAEAIVAKNKDLETKPVVAKEILTALDMDKGDVSLVVASIHAMKQAGKSMVSREDFDKLQNSLRERDADEIVAKAGAEGKITPDQSEWAKAYAKRDLEGFKAFVAKAPVVVPVDKLPGKEEKVDGAVTDQAVLTVAKMFGNTADDLKKYGAGN